MTQTIIGRVALPDAIAAHISATRGDNTRAARAFFSRVFGPVTRGAGTAPWLAGANELGG